MRVLVLAMAVTLAACSPAAPPGPAAQPPAPAPPATAHWVPIDALPAPDATIARVRRGQVEVRLDRGATRWVLEPGAAPRRAEGVDWPPPVALAMVPSGILILDRARHARLARDLAGPFARAFTPSAQPCDEETGAPVVYSS